MAGEYYDNQGNTIWESAEAKRMMNFKVKQDHLRLCAHIRQALSTPSGVVLREWLKENCFMNDPTTLDHIESNNAAQRVLARRDLYITLDNLFDQGVDYNVTDTE